MAFLSSSRRSHGRLSRARQGTFATILVFGLSGAGVRALTEGVINTRPECFPAQPTPVPLSGNYIQGPDAVRLDNGDVAIVLDGGYGQGEAIMTLLYPASGAVPPRWYPIYATNNWYLNLERKEWEAAFPSAIYWNGAWRIMYTASYWYDDRTGNLNNWGGIGRIDSPSLTSQPASLLLQPWSWVQSIDPACIPFGTCTDINPAFPNPVVQGGKLYLYYRDGNYTVEHPGCNLIRRQIKADATLTPFSSVTCVSFDLTGIPAGHGRPENYPGNIGKNIYDVAIGQDGKIYLLAGPFPYAGIIDEFVSDNGGVNFHYSGVSFEANNYSPLPGYNTEFAADATYLTDKTGLIIEPRVIVGMVGSYTTGCTPIKPPGCNLPGAPPVNGTWRLYYWAYPGAVLPPSWGADASSCPAPPVVAAGVPGYQGNFDGTSCQVMSGWMWDWYQPNVPINVSIYDNGSFLATVPANTYRLDLAVAGYFGNAYHGFSYNLPSSINDGQPHTLSARYAGTPQDTGNSPRTITCPEPSLFYTVTPCRVADTRNAPGPYGGPALAAATTRNFSVGGQCGIPTDAKSVAFNITVTGATAQGSLRLFPGGGLPLAEAISYNPGQARANNAIIALGAGQIAAYCDQPSGSTDVIFDVYGYFK